MIAGMYLLTAMSKTVLRPSSIRIDPTTRPGINPPYGIPKHSSSGPRSEGPKHVSRRRLVPGGSGCNGLPQALQKAASSSFSTPHLVQRTMFLPASRRLGLLSLVTLLPGLQLVVSGPERLNLVAVTAHGLLNELVHVRRYGRQFVPKLDPEPPLRGR